MRKIIFLVPLLLASFFASSQNVSTLPNSILPLDTASYTLLAQPSATTLRKASLNRIFLTGKNYYDALYRPISDTTSFIKTQGTSILTANTTINMGSNNLTFSGDGIFFGKNSLRGFMEASSLANDINSGVNASTSYASIFANDYASEHGTVVESKPDSLTITYEDYIGVGRVNGLTVKNGENNFFGRTFFGERLRLFTKTGSDYSSNFSNGQLWLFNNLIKARVNSTTYDIPVTLTGNNANRLPIWQAGSILGQTPYTIPTTNGSNGQVLTTNGSGAATWETPSGGGVTAGDKGEITVTLGPENWTIDNNAIATAKIADNAVTYAKIQTVSPGVILGNSGGSAATIEQVSIGSGLTLATGTLSATRYYAPTSLVANASDGDFTATVNGVHNILDGVATADRVITIPTGANGDVMKFYNTENAYVWSFTGATVYLADRVTVVTQLDYNYPCFMEKIDGLWVITN